MDAPPPEEDIRPFVTVARYLAQLGFSAPRILAEDERRGFLLLEDLGDDTYTRLLADGRTDETALYLLATDVLIDIHRRADAIPAGLAPYDADLLWREASLFTDWYLPAVTGQETDAGLRDSFEAAWRQVFPAVLASPQTLVLRYTHFESAERRSPQVAEDYAKWFLARLRTLEPLLGEHAFLASDRFTAADVSVGYALLLAQHLGLDARFTPEVARYWERLRAREGYRRALAAQERAALAQGVATLPAPDVRPPG